MATKTIKKKTTTAAEKASVTKTDLEQEALKEVSETIEMKPAVKKTTKKKAKAETKGEEKPASKKTAKVASETKTEAKTTAKKASKEAKETKVEEKPVSKKETKKVSEAKVEEKPVSKKETKEVSETKAEVKVKKATKKQRVEAFEALELHECINKMRQMGVQLDYEHYVEYLMDEADLKVLENNIIEGNDLKAKSFDFDKTGLHPDLVAVTLKKVQATMNLKASDYEQIKKDIEKATKNETKDVETYLEQFKLVEKVLMLAQYRKFNELAQEEAYLNCEIKPFLLEFMDLAYSVIPTMKYDDVKFYESFIYAVLSQFYDLFVETQLRVQLDVADLYIIHGDYGRGERGYDYVLRDNAIKDYIYYRYAHVYEAISLDRAKEIAYKAFSCIDDRYTYYQNLVDIMNK